MDTSSKPTKHIDAARRRLAHLGGLADKTSAAERKIAEAAHTRLATVQDELSKLSRRALLDDGAAKQYLDLTEEFGALQTVIAQSAAAGA